MLRQHVALSFKEMKQLKEAMVADGTQAPFTLAIVESFAAFNLTPSDWQQLCHMVQYYLEEITYCGGENIKKIVYKWLG